jgi:hypothetical protein
MIPMTEIWKDIQGFGEQYEVSNTGWVRRRATDFTTPFGTIQIPPIYIQPQVSGRSLIVPLIYKEIDSKAIHQPYRHIKQLVAEAFIPNPEGHNHVRIKDGDVLNNSSDNLEWFSPNYQDGTQDALMYKWKVKNVATGEIYDSRKDLARKLGCSYEYLCNRIRLGKSTKHGHFIMIPPEDEI